MARKFLVPISVQRLFGLLAPTQDSDAANKKYVDDLKKRHLMHKGGRFYCYTDTRWVTDSDDNYGIGYYQWNESGTTAAEPVVEAEHLGMYMPEGVVMSKLNLIVRPQNSQITDFEIRIFHRKPNPITRWETGIDNDAEMTNTLLYSGKWSDNASTLLVNDQVRQILDLGDVELTEAGHISVYIKPIGALTATRYIRCAMTWEYLL